MKVIKILLLFLFFGTSFSIVSAQKVSTKKIEKVLAEFDANFTKQEEGKYEFYYGDVKFFCFVNKDNNMVRILSPIDDIVNLSNGNIQRSMEANHKSPRNVQYSISNDIIWSTFINPLDTTSKDMIVDGIYRVYANNRSFGTTYSSDYFAYNDKSNVEENED